VLIAVAASTVVVAEAAITEAALLTAAEDRVTNTLGVFAGVLAGATKAATIGAAVFAEVAALACTKGEIELADMVLIEPAPDLN